MSRVEGQEPKAGTYLWTSILGNSAQQFRVLNQKQFIAQMAILETMLSFFSKNPPILTTRQKCIQLTLLLHRMTMFGMNGLIFHWTCHPLLPPHRQNTPHWFLMAVFWRGAQLKRKEKCLLSPSIQNKGWEIAAKWAEKVTSSTDSGFYCTQYTWRWVEKMGEIFFMSLGNLWGKLDMVTVSTTQLCCCR